MYYEHGVKIGDNTYLLLDECNDITLINGSSNTEETEEYIKLNNEYDEKLQLRDNFQKDLSVVRRLDKLSKKWNIGILLYTIFGQICCAILGGDIPIYIVMAIITIGMGSLVKYGACSSKKIRQEIKAEANEELSKINKEIEEMTKKLETLKEKIEYKEFNLKKEIELPIVAEENKKINVKMRVLKLK